MPAGSWASGTTGRRSNTGAVYRRGGRGGWRRGGVRAELRRPDWTHLQRRALAERIVGRRLRRSTRWGTNASRACTGGRYRTLNDCIFCIPQEEHVFLRNELAYALSDAFPVTRLHSLIIPHRHTRDYFSLTTDELLACNDTAQD